MTPAQLLSNVREQFSEPNPTFNTDGAIYSYMWQAETEIANLIPCTEATDTSTTTVSGTREYSFPSGVQRIHKVSWNAYPLKKMDLKDLDYLEETAYGYTGSTGDPVYYYEWANKIGLSPIPDSAQTIKLYYLKDPTELTDTSTSFTIPSWLAHYIGDYCLYRMYLKDKEASRSELHLNLWVKHKQDAINEWNKRKAQNRIRIVKDADEYPDTILGMI